MSTFKYKGIGGCDCICDIELEPLDNGMMLVMITESPENVGTSVTNAAELLHPQIIREFGLEDEDLVWIEHYPPVDGLQEESYDLVRFTLEQDANGQPLLRPAWQRISDDQAMAFVFGECPFSPEEANCLIQ